MLFGIVFHLAVAHDVGITQVAADDVVHVIRFALELDLLVDC